MNTIVRNIVYTVLGKNKSCRGKKGKIGKKKHTKSFK